MANEHKIDVNKRENIGKKALKHLRKEGNIPGVYYSSSTENSTPIFISQNELSKAIKSGARIFNISVGGNKQNVLFKSVQYHPITEQVLHVDLYGINMNNPINIKIPIQLIGTAIGVLEEGGVLNQAFNEIEIQCLPADIPEFIEVDISDLNLGDSINVGSIKRDEKFSLITSEETVVASVTHAMKEIEPIVEVDDDELFLDEEGKSAEDGDGESKDDTKIQEKSTKDETNSTDQKGENS